MSDSPLMTVGRKLVDLCNQGKFIEAVQELYGPEIVNIEAAECPGYERITKGYDKILERSKHWMAANEVHSVQVKGPFPHGDDRFAVFFSMDMTAKEGPMANQRMTMDEVGVYTVKNGKIIQEEFFYAMG